MMKAFPTLIFFLALQDPAVPAANICEGVEGGNLTAICLFSGRNNVTLSCKQEGINPKTEYLFCGDTCDANNDFTVSVKDPDQCDRCRMNITRARQGPKTHLNITITNLTMSDSGHYSCQSRNGNRTHLNFEIHVYNAPETHETTTGTHQSSTHPGTESINHNYYYYVQDTRVAQFLAPILVIIAVIIISVALIIYCKKRGFLQQKNPPLKTEHDRGQHDNPVYEEIKENTENKMYTEHHVQKPGAANSTAVYCVASMAQNKVEGNSTEYFTVQLPNSAAPSSTDTPLEHVKSISEHSEVQYSNRNLPSLSSCDEGTAASVSVALSEENSTHCTHAAPASLYPDLPP
ncbi:hypothetical protein OJAV_G00071000 [Oryzias javanicus]|uniref:Ig-like domain-containing protein n=1 Tax=Oryzias javanicus TaxID=123683 RepID=A0A3S2N0M1_ORYJA|nr:hypothetical protein OJAV_G00071000 [Oryzias javanicus]